MEVLLLGPVVVVEGDRAVRIRALLSGRNALSDRAAAALDLAEVLHLASLHEEGVAPGDEALSLYAVKGDLTGLERARRRLVGLAPSTGV